MRSLTSAARDLLPPRQQVAAKYWYGRLSGSLDSEMLILRSILGGGDHLVQVGTEASMRTTCGRWAREWLFSSPIL
jgi:hypothetical protein